MSRHIRRFGPYVLVFAVLIGLTALLVPTPERAEATSFSDPWWTQDSPSPECVGCNSCGCPGPSEFFDVSEYDGASDVRLSVSNRTGYPMLDVMLGSSPTRLGSLAVGLKFRADLSGESQVGGGAILSLENTLQKVVINELDPDSPGGTLFYWHRSDGLVVTYATDGSGGFETTDCNVQWALTHNSPYTLTNLQGDQMSFDESTGMPSAYTDRNGNITSFTYSGYQLTAMTDDRSQSWSFDHNGDDYLDEIQTPDGTTWTLGYDDDGYLDEINYPATDDQPSGSTVTLTRDAYHRITAVEDRRGNTVYEIHYVGTTGQVDYISKAGQTISWSYSAGETDRTDQYSKVHRTFYSGANITQTDMYISSTSTYATVYTYSGNKVIKAVYPRGNRVDWTWDGNDNLTERRRRTTDTDTDDASDIVDSWTYSNNFVATYTDSLGNVTTYTRDGYGNVTNIDFPDVSYPSSQEADKDIEYNASGQVTEVTDEEGKITDYSYYTTGTSRGLLEKIEVDPTGLDLETAFTYDTAGNIATVTDPRGNQSGYTWDALRRLKQKTSPAPLSIDTKFEYDAMGNMTKREIENLDKEGTRSRPTPGSRRPTATRTSTRSRRSWRRRASRPRARRRLSYNAKGRKQSVTKPEGNGDAWTTTSGISWTCSRGQARLPSNRPWNTSMTTMAIWSRSDRRRGQRHDLHLRPVRPAHQGDRPARPLRDVDLRRAQQGDPDRAL